MGWWMYCTLTPITAPSWDLAGRHPGTSCSASQRQTLCWSSSAVDELTSTILDGKDGPVILVRLFKHPHTVTVSVKSRCVEDTQRLQLESEGTLPNCKLGGVCPVQSVNTIGPGIRAAVYYDDQLNKGETLAETL